MRGDRKNDNVNDTSSAKPNSGQAAPGPPEEPMLRNKTRNGIETN